LKWTENNIIFDAISLKGGFMDRNLALEVVRVTEAAALHAAFWVGRGDEKSADHAAVEAMRKAFQAVHIKGVVVIGEGERDEAPMLYIGENVGQWDEDDPEVDIALDPLEGTTITARGDVNAVSVISVAPRGTLLYAPDTYMMKLAVGPAAKGVIDLNKSIEANVRNVASALGMHLENFTVVILDRPRHKDMIDSIRKMGCRIILIRDGDVQGAIATCFENTGIQMLVGTGGAPEGVLAASALKCLNGDFQGKLMFRNEEEKVRAKKMGVEDLEKIYKLNELVKDEVMFASTGVTDGSFLKGVKFFKGGAKTHSLVLRSKTGTIRFLETTHFFDKKPIY
jgi:fructose-1,6-bisphosphatase II